ncbi:MAG: hypothetical protein M0P01_03190 [Treponema sp.]|nr:hypothetical protein [Treponema sp.]
MRKTACLFLMGILSAAVFAQSQEQIIQNGIHYHNLAKTESDGYAEKCKDTLLPYIETNMTARAYYGSAVTMQAEYCSASNPIHALDLLREGSSYIDDAVKRDNSNPGLHILRLVNGIQVSESSPFKRYAVLKDDAAWLSKKENLAGLDNDTLALVYLYRGLYKIEESDIDSALDLFDQAAAVSPGSDSAEEAQKQTARYEE